MHDFQSHKRHGASVATWRRYEIAENGAGEGTVPMISRVRHFARGLTVMGIDTRCGHAHSLGRGKRIGDLDARAGRIWVVNGSDSTSDEMSYLLPYRKSVRHWWCCRRIQG